MSKKDLLFEIGCEEIPVDYIPSAMKQMEKLLSSQLADERLTFENISVEATPRRFVLIVTGLDDKQPTVKKELLGPKKQIAFKDDGTLTAAGQGFLKKAGLSQEGISIKDDRLFAEVEETGQEAIAILPAVLVNVIKKTSFPKSMRWEQSGARFARPVRWLLALLGDRIIDISFAGIQSSDQTQLHPLEDTRFEQVKSIADYEKLLEQGHVMLSVKKRRNTIAALLEAEASNNEGKLVADEKLLDMVTMMAEWPGVVAGEIGGNYMTMPREIVTTAMREHQRYFAIEDSQGNLKPLFLTVHDNPTGQADSIRPGCERVLEARLKDAEFFYNEDLKVPLKDKVSFLERVLWIKGLGNMLDKTNRIKSLAAWLASALQPECEKDVTEAARLCKADLITNMIQEKEFNKLQGFMGGIYAREQGTEQTVCDAIAEHYKPRWAGDGLPQSQGGCLLAIADKLDNLMGCWSAGFAPTGTKDPYALRRAAQGIIAIILDNGYRIDLKKMLKQAMTGFSEFKSKEEQVIEEVVQFIQGRLETELAQRQIAPDLIQAVLGVWWDDIAAVVKKAEAVHQLRNKEGFNDAITTFSRVVNILPKNTPRQVAPQTPDSDVKTGLFSEDAEHVLYDSLSKVSPAITTEAAKGDYEAAFKQLSSLKGDVDLFFDKVMVMDKNEEIKQNRIHLLTNLAAKIWSIADFSKLVIKA